MVIKKSAGSKFFIVVFLVLAIVAPFIYKCSRYSNQYDFEIEKYVVEATIDEYGDMHIVEKVTNVYDSRNTVFYKNLIYGKNNSFSNNIDQSKLVEDVRVVVEDYRGVVFDTLTDDGDDYHFVGYSYNNDRDERGDRIQCSDTDTNCEMIFYYDSRGISETTTFTYEYTIQGVVTEYKDISEFNWVMLGYQPMNVNNISISITLPDGEYDIKDMDTFFHGSEYAKREFVDNNKILITADDMVVGEKIEARLLLDTDIFTSIRTENKFFENRKQDILNFEENQIDTARNEYILYIYGSWLVFGLAILLLGLLALSCYKKCDKEYPTEFYNEYYRELPASYPPAVMGYLYKFREIDNNDLTATLLDLIRRKYLILENPSTSVNEDNPNYKIILNEEKSRDDLTESEKFLIKWFIEDIGDGKKVSSQQLSNYCKDYSNAQCYQNSNRKWLSLVEKEANKYDFFDKKVNSNRSKYTKLGLLVIIAEVLLVMVHTMKGYTISIMFAFSLVFVLLAYMVYVNSFNRRSKQGNEDFVRWRAFAKFLEDFSNFEDYPVPSLIIWEHYLVYATSFGIADKVMKQLKLKFNVDQIEDTDCTFVLYYGLRYHYFSGINHTIRNNMSTAINVIAAHNSSRSGMGGGSRGGGGFSGGSSFGGGGGSFGGR